MNKGDLLLKLLEKELTILDRAQHNLVYSLQRVNEINFAKSLTDSELERMDSFSSRFLRLYEVLINQVIRNTLGLLRESQKTYLDNMNKAEALGLITSALDIDEIRKLRNQVALAYLEEEWIPIYKNLIMYAGLLIESCDLSKHYANHKFSI